jgi:hypothetical protein
MCMKALTCVVLFLVSPVFAQESYDRLLHHWDYDESAPLNIQQAGIQERDGVTIYDISFSSPVSDRSAAVGPNGGMVNCLPSSPFGTRPIPGSDLRALVHARV